MWLKFRYNKPLLLLALLAWDTMARAQRSLLFKVEYTLGAADILEDSEGGFLVQTGIDFRRYDPAGNLLWIYGGWSQFNGRGKIRFDPKNKWYVTSSQYTAIGGYHLLAFNLEGKLLWEEKRDWEDKPGHMLDVVEDFLIDTTHNRIVITGSTRYYGTNEQALWIAFADLQGRIYREERSFMFGTNIGSPLMMSHLQFTPSGNEYLAAARVGFYGKYNVGRNAHFVRFDTLGRIVKARSPGKQDTLSCPRPENIYTNSDEVYDFRRLNDSEYYALVDYDGSWTYLHIYDEYLNLKRCGYADQDEKLKRYYGLQDCDSFFFSLGYPFTYNLDRLTKYTKNLDIIWQRELKIPGHPKVPGQPWEDAILDAVVKPSARGGYYGYARYSEWNKFVYIFRLDSLGNFNVLNVEDPEAVRLAPNPAHNRLRFEVPYYMYHVDAVFYDLTGRECLRLNGHKDVNHDISALRPGLYLVHTTIQETGRKQVHKLWVE
jgi:hypothetical protein